MSSFLDTLKERLADAQKRAQEVTARLQQVQQEHQTVHQELFGWQKAVEAETIREQQATTKQAAGISPSTLESTAARRTLLTFGTSETDSAASNKTEAIRELLRQHPAGMSPAQIWGVMKNQVAHRQYIYSVLKRLKDKKQVIEKRGKYFFQTMSEPEGVQRVLQ